MTAARKLKVTRPEPEDDEQEPDFPQWETGDKVKGESLRWLLPGRIPLGGITILEGEKGVLKSTFAVHLASCLTRGKPLLGRRKSKPGRIVWLSAEDPIPAVVRPRLLAAGADLTRMVFAPVLERGIRYKPCFPNDLPWLEATVEKFNPLLVVLDPFSSFVPPGCDLRNDQDIHDVMDPIAELSFAKGFSVLCCRNLNKNRYASALDRGLGGAAVGGIARSILTIDWPDRKKTDRFMRVTAGNVTGSLETVRFGVSDSKGFGIISDLKEIPLEQEETCHPEDDEAERDVREDAKKMLRALLDKGPVDTTVIIQEALSIQVSPRTLRTAKKELGITSHRIGKKKPAKWQWKRPVGGWPKTPT